MNPTTGAPYLSTRRMMGPYFAPPGKVTQLFQQTTAPSAAASDLSRRDIAELDPLDFCATFCTFCKQYFQGNRLTLSMHFRDVHPYEKKHYRCPSAGCDSSFTQLQPLQRHYESTHIEPRHHCTSCRRVLKRREYLSYHIRNQHPSPAVEAWHVAKGVKPPLYTFQQEGSHYFYTPLSDKELWDTMAELESEQ